MREYHVEGDRLRFYSLDSSQWEEMPAALVDWDATKRIEADEAQRQAAILARAHVREEGLRAGPLDTDASMEVAPGVFLPPGEGLFVFDGKAVLPLTQALANSNLSKGKMAEKIFMPVPVVPTRHTISLPGIRASLRVNTTEPEFYMRTTDAREPQLRLIRARVRKDARQLENLDALYDQQRETGDTVPIQLWEIAQGVYRFTLGQTLEPGEYALAESIEGQDGVERHEPLCLGLRRGRERRRREGEMRRSRPGRVARYQQKSCSRHSIEYSSNLRVLKSGFSRESYPSHST